MTEGPALGAAIAFAAGLLSFLSPCVLPLVPSYLGFVTGLTLDELAGRRQRAMLHAVLFVCGFSLVFILLGMGSTALSAALRYYRDWVARAGGVLIILFGLYVLGAFRIAAFERERRLHLDRKPLGYLGSVLVGVAFGAGWTPCLGPILGGILTLAATEGEVARGAALLGWYSAGLAVPFLGAAFAVETFLDWVNRFRRFLPWVQRAGGILLIGVGLLLVTGQFTRLAGWLQSLTPEFIRSRI